MINIKVVFIVDEISVLDGQNLCYNYLSLGHPHREGYADLYLSISGLKFLASILLQFCYFC